MQSETLSLDYVLPPDALAGRVIAVTGAGTGLGLAAARAFAAHGATVLLLGKRVRALEKAFDAIVAAGGPEPVIHPLDLASATEAEHAALAEGIAGSLGSLYGLVHSAGVLNALAPLEHCDADDWNATVQVNLSAAFLLTRACLPLLRAGGDARVLFTSAPEAREPRAYWGPYAVAKAGVEALAAVLADEEESDARVRVACLDPGRVRTRIHLAAWPGTAPGDIPEPEALAPAYLRFMGPAGRDLHGRRLLVAT